MKMINKSMPMTVSYFAVISACNKICKTCSGGGADDCDGDCIEGYFNDGGKCKGRYTTFFK